jgi:hypothetical protein
MAGSQTKTLKEALIFRILQARSFRLAVCALAALALATGSTALAADQISRPFTGKAVNGGTVTVSQQRGKTTLTLSADFQVPGSPDPHWQVVDSKGGTYLLDRLKLKDDRINTSITLPAYVPDVARVQMWCAWAEVLLGEAPFATPIVASR